MNLLHSQFANRGLRAVLCVLGIAVCVLFVPGGTSWLDLC